MLIILTLLVLIVITVLFKLYYTSINLSNLLYLSTLVYLVYCLFVTYYREYIKVRFTPLYSNLESKIKKHLTRKNIAAVIIGVSFLAGFSNIYYLGGDDTKLFYVYPKDYLINFASNVSPANSVSAMVGFLPSSSIFFFAFFLTFLKTILPFINLQSMLYIANILFGIYFFYLFTDYIIQENVKHKKWILLASASFYVFSLFNIYILYNARLIAVYLISIFPLTLYLFLRATKEKKYYLMGIVAIIWSVFCLVSASSFWFFAALLVIIPVILYLIRKDKLSALINTSLLGILLIIINFHWLYYLPYATLFNRTAMVTNSVLSQNFLKESSDGLRNIAEMNEIIFPLNNLFHYKIQDNFKWPYLEVFKNWYLKLIPLTTIFIITIIFGGLFKKRDELGKLYIISSASLLLGLYLFTVNLGGTELGNWGIELFVWLNNNVPGFVAFRNMYDKFGFALSFIFALSLAVSLIIIEKILKSESLINKLNSSVFIISLLIAFPFLSGRLRNLPVWKTQNSFYTTIGFNQDYLNLTKFIKNRGDAGRYLTLPLTRGNIAFIQDKNMENHYYVGVSPLLIMSGKNDYSGSLSFGLFESEINKFFQDKKYDDLGRILQKTNTKYIVTNNTISKDMQNNYLLGEGIYDLQNDLFYKTILGEKVQDFGDRYSIYKINQDYDNDKIFIDAGGTKASAKKIEFNKITDTEYDVEIEYPEEGERLIFLEPYFNKWELYNYDGHTKLASSTEYSGWANSWVINKPKGSETKIKLKIIFSPAKIRLPLVVFSSTSIFLTLTYVVLSLRKNKNG